MLKQQIWNEISRFSEEFELDNAHIIGVLELIQTELILNYTETECAPE